MVWDKTYLTIKRLLSRDAQNSAKSAQAADDEGAASGRIITDDATLLQRDTASEREEGDAEAIAAIFDVAC